MVKEDAASLLRRRLESPKWEPKVLAMSGVTDPYQPVERRLQITRGCLEVLAEMRHPVGLITKNPMIVRDLDLLSELAGYEAASAAISITTLDPGLSAKMEPRAGQSSSAIGGGPQAERCRGAGGRHGGSGGSGLE